jgi:hypothetical protein
LIGKNKVSRDELAEYHWKKMHGAINSALIIFGTLLPIAVVSYRPPLRHLALILRFPKAAIHQVQQTTHCGQTISSEADVQRLN